MDYHSFIRATLQLEQAAAERRRSLGKRIEQDVADALDRGDRACAAAAIEAFLRRQPGATRWWHELALIRLQQGDAAAAAAGWQQALRCNLADVSLLHRMGQCIAAAGHDPARFAEQAWGVQEPPAWSASAHGLNGSPGYGNACLAVLREDWTQVLPALRNNHQAQPGDRKAAASLAFVLERLGRDGEAQCVLAVYQLASGQIREAVQAFEAAPAADAQGSEFLDNYLRALRYAGEEERAIRIAGAVAPESRTRTAWQEWAGALLDLGLDAQARETLRQGAAVLDDEYLGLQAELALPAVPISQAAMDQAHRRVCRSIRALPARPLPVDSTALASLERGLQPNFLLSYLGEPYVEEARAYGQFVERVMGARFPRFREPLPVRGRESGRRIRIGCATSFVNHHVVMKCFAGWLERADRGLFETHLFPLATERNEVTGYLAGLVDTFHAQATGTEAAARQIRECELDILVYPEIGLDALSFRLAAMRLAPVQCVAGGHPATTGLSTLDYFLSAAAAEPEDAAGHYTERLVTLPGMGICIPLPEFPAERLSRGAFGLESDQVVYLSTQGLFKHLPAHDDLFARIAESVENAVFVFVEGHYPAWTRTFSQRLRQSFQKRRLDPDRYLRFVPRQDYSGYLCLNAASDVFLDPPGGFSGGMTIRDALACGLPVLTLPGRLMRTRQGFGLLAELGITDTIATDLDDYVRLAVRLGRTPAWREELSRRIQERRGLLFDDTHCVAALEAFFRWTAGVARPGDDALFGLGPMPPAP